MTNKEKFMTLASRIVDKGQVVYEKPYFLIANDNKVIELHSESINGSVGFEYVYHIDDPDSFDELINDLKWYGNLFQELLEGIE